MSHYGSFDVHMFVTLQRESHKDNVAWIRMSESDITLQNCQALLFIHELDCLSFTFSLMLFGILNLSNPQTQQLLDRLDYSVPYVCFCRHTVGDSKVPFCLQSCVKPLKYAVAVNDYGTEHVHSFIGKEPSGLRFNKLFLNEDGEITLLFSSCSLRSKALQSILETPCTS